MNLTTYLYLVSSLRMCGDIPPLPHMPLWYSQGLPSYLTNLLPSVNNRNATCHPEDKGSMFFYIYMVQKLQKEHHMRN